VHQRTDPHVSVNKGHGQCEQCPKSYQHRRGKFLLWLTGQRQEYAKLPGENVYPLYKRRTSEGGGGKRKWGPPSQDLSITGNQWPTSERHQQDSLRWVQSKNSAPERGLDKRSKCRVGRPLDFQNSLDQVSSEKGGETKTEKRRKKMPGKNFCIL